MEGLFFPFFCLSSIPPLCYLRFFLIFPFGYECVDLNSSWACLRPNLTPRENIWGLRGLRILRRSPQNLAEIKSFHLSLIFLRTYLWRNTAPKPLVRFSISWTGLLQFSKSFILIYYFLRFTWYHAGKWLVKGWNGLSAPHCMGRGAPRDSP